MALTFDHGGALPLADQLIGLVQSLLADITGPDDSASTEFGPVLRTVTPIPWNIKNLLVRGGIETFREIVARNPAPCALVFVGSREPTEETRPATSATWMLEAFELVVYLVDEHRAGEMSGRYSPDNVTDKKPGLHAMGDLVISRMANAGDDDWQSLVYEGLDPLWAAPSFSIHETRFRAVRSWQICRPRNALPIDEVEATHDEGGAGVIAAQKVISV
jgi:hypothetical protein